jgi:hypothetical protein
LFISYTYHKSSLDLFTPYPRYKLTTSKQLPVQQVHTCKGQIKTQHEVTVPWERSPFWGTCKSHINGHQSHTSQRVMLLTD